MEKKATRKTKTPTAKITEPDVEPTEDLDRCMGLIDLDTTDEEIDALVEAIESMGDGSG